MLLDELATLLVTQNVGGLPGTTQAAATGWMINKGFHPPTPNKVITLFETGGFPDDPNAADDLPERPTFQVRVRGEPLQYPEARLKCDAVREAFYTVANEEIAGRFFGHVTMGTAPFALGVDANNRPEFTLNGSAIRSRI